MRVLDLSLVAAVFLVVVDFGCCQMDGTEKCGGLVKQFCTPCEKDILEADQPTFCSEVSLMCQRQFCNPMCLKEAWDIDVSCEGAFKGCADVDDSVKDAMVAMFKGWGCVDALECCEDDSRLHEWVQDNFFGDDFPNSPVPLKSCIIPLKGNPKDVAKLRKKTCDDCKASMIFKLAEKSCPMYATGQTSPIQDLKSHKGGFLETEESNSMGMKGPSVAPMMTYEPFVIKDKMYGMGMKADQESKDMIMRPADYVTQLERCLNLADAAKKKFSAMEKDFGARSCACLGCCVPDEPNGAEDCPWPTTFPFGRR